MSTKRKPIQWYSKVKVTANKETGVTRYYLQICDVWRRVSLSDYHSRVADGRRCSNFLTKTNGPLTYYTKTVHGVHY